MGDGAWARPIAASIRRSADRSSTCAPPHRPPRFPLGQKSVSLWLMSGIVAAAGLPLSFICWRAPAAHARLPARPRRRTARYSHTHTWSAPTPPHLPSARYRGLYWAAIKDGGARWFWFFAHMFANVVWCWCGGAACITRRRCHGWLRL